VNASRKQIDIFDILMFVFLIPCSGGERLGFEDEIPVHERLFQLGIAK
jgi:hypothetical protein